MNTLVAAPTCQQCGNPIRSGLGRPSRCLACRLGSSSLTRTVYSDPLPELDVPPRPIERNRTVRQDFEPDVVRMLNRLGHEPSEYGFLPSSRWVLAVRVPKAPAGAWSKPCAPGCRHLSAP